MQLLGLTACLVGSVLSVQVALGAPPVIASLKPDSGPAGTLVTISGKGFTPTAGFRGSPGAEGDAGGNTVRLGSEVTLKNLNSMDGATVQFEIPQNVAPAVYSLTVVNSNGVSNSVNLTITARVE